MKRLLLEFSWQINFFFVFLPWIMEGASIFIFHLVLETWLNKGWAEGNMFLMAQTVFGAIQLALSFPLIAEMDNYLRNFKFVRFISASVGRVYNFIYLVFAYKFVALIMGWEGDSTSYTMNMVITLVIGYMLILHLPIYMINDEILAKELSMEVFQFFNKAAGSDADDISLGFNDMVALFLQILNFFNPWWWFGNDHTIRF